MNKKKDLELKIDKNTNIAELVFAHPEAEEILAAFGLHCASCFAAGFDTLEQGAKIHGMLDEEIEEMIEEVKTVIKQSKDNDSKDI